LIAGAIGGWTSFGYIGGIAGATSEQITLYLFARGLEGLIRLGVKKSILPGVMDIRKPIGFKMLAAFSLAVILYLTEYQPDLLRPSFMGVMKNLYHESNSGPLSVPMGFAPVVAVAMTTMLGGVFTPTLGLESVLNAVLGK
jgi:peroxisomal membrane protein 4